MALVDAANLVLDQYLPPRVWQPLLKARNEAIDWLAAPNCSCRVVPAEPFPRLAWAEDCPHHGRGMNPFGWQDDPLDSDGQGASDEA